MINIDNMDNKSQLLLILYGMASYKYGARLGNIASIAALVSHDCKSIGLCVEPDEAIMALREARELYEHLTK